MAFWNRNKEEAPEPKNELDEIITQIEEMVAERKQILKEVKTIYQPQKDNVNSRYYGFVNANNSLTKLSLKELNSFEESYQIKLPPLIKRVLHKIGSGGYLNHHFIDSRKKLYRPVICLEKPFLDACINAGVSPSYLEHDIHYSLDLTSNQFTRPDIQKVYESLGSKRDELIAILYYVGHDGYVLLNRNNDYQIAVYDVSGYSNHPFFADGIEYESPYYKFLKDVNLNTAFLGGVNTRYWKSMLERIRELNTKDTYGS